LFGFYVIGLPEASVIDTMSVLNDDLETMGDNGI
jgi:hypothetical protein